MDSGNGSNNDVVTIKTEVEDDAEDNEESTENAADGIVKKENASDGADGAEGNADGENKDDDRLVAFYSVQKISKRNQINLQIPTICCTTNINYVFTRQ